MPYKRIMVAVDDSETSVLALKESIRLAKISNSQLCILHIVNLVPTYTHSSLTLGLDISSYEESLKKSATALLDKMKEIANQQSVTPEIKNVEIIKDLESIPEKIVATVNDWKADLLVLGTHGRRGVRHFFIGSVAEEVIRLSTIPVLLIRSGK